MTPPQTATLELVRGDYSLPAAPPPCAVAIGGFDSLHQGHQAVIANTVARAAALGLPATVIFFEPLPVEFFRGGARVRVHTLRRRLELLSALGARRALCLRFNRRVAAMSAKAFIDRVLVGGLAARHVTVGAGFRFGRGGAGDVATLRAAGARAGFAVDAVPTVALDGERVSSSAVRAALRAGDIALAERYLARPYVVSGRVGRGAGRGAGLGFPTANLIVPRPPPLHGVFGAAVSLGAAPPRRAVVNAGLAPTFGGERYKIEVHIPGLRARLYARRLNVRLLKKLRDERKFASAAQLKAQVEQDIAAAAGLALPAQPAQDRPPRPART